MSRKFMNASEMGRKGGIKNRDTKPKEYWAEIGARGRATIIKRDPDFYKRLAASGLHAREVRNQEYIRLNIAEDATTKLTKLLIGS